MNLNRLRRPQYLTGKPSSGVLRDEIVVDLTAYSGAMANAGVNAESSVPKSAHPETGESLTAGPPYWWGGLSLNAGEYTTSAEPIDLLFAYPFMVGKKCRLRAMKFFMRAQGAAGSVFRFGVYESRNDGDGNKPGKLLFDSGELNGDTNYWVDCFRVATCGSGISLAPGVYWWAYLAGVSAPTWSCTHWGYMNDLVNNSPGSLSPLFGWLVPMTYTSLPSDYPSEGLTWGGNQPIHCWFSFMT